MIWLRLFIAVIALTISSDLSAWGQPQKQINRNKRGRTISSAPSASAAPQVSAPSASTQPQQMQVNSPEGFYDCKGIANGANDRDPEGGCCLQSERTEAPCFLCIYKPNFCDKQTGVCRTTTTADMNKRCCDAHPFPCNDCNRPTMTFCELQLNQCNTTATPDKNNRCCSAHPSPCNDCNRPSMTFCELQLNQCGATADVGCGCGKPAPVPRPTVGCPTSRCRTSQNGWPMMHNPGSGCPGLYPFKAGPADFRHGQTFYLVILTANALATVPCYPPGRTDPATCADPGKSGFIYATDLPHERLTNAEAASAQWRICDNGVIKAGTTLSPPLMYCAP